MALVVSSLKNNIKSILNDMSTRKDKDAAIEELATRLTAAVDVYIKSATVTVTGTCPSGACTGTGIIS